MVFLTAKGPLIKSYSKSPRLKPSSLYANFYGWPEGHPFHQTTLIRGSLNPDEQ